MSRMNRLKQVYITTVAICTSTSGVLASSTFAYENRSNGPASMISSAVLGAILGSVGGAILGITSPVALPGALIGYTFQVPDRVGKKLIDTMNEVVARPNGSNQTSPRQASPPGSPSAPVSI